MILKRIAVAAICLVAALTTWAQSSTEGKEFWVSSTIVCSPGGASKQATPYIAVSAEKACQVTITGGLNNAINITQRVAAGSWSQFGDATAIGTVNNNPLVGPVNVVMNTTDWYPQSASNASTVSSLAGNINHYGLHITATENISVYVILSSENSMDASNILPQTAIQSEYYTQDYSPVVKSDFSNTVSMATILATEDNTVVDIVPNGATADGHASGVAYNVTLQQGQTYYLMSAPNQQIGGTHIKARNDKKIAVYCGIPLTNIPSNIAARDACFEQAMPVDYWGNQFVVTRSLWKNGNLIGITAMEDGTEVKIDGNSVSFINAGETYYVMLQGAVNLPHAKNPGTGPVDLVIAADVAYIETSCPCAVYSYDTGNSYVGSDKTTSEVQNSKGDPASVWVSPLQQKINTITFGTCYTTKTTDHFLNVIAETATCSQTTLLAMYGAQRINKTSLLSWTPVPGNPTYSYARAQLGTEATKNFSVFKLHNPSGIIAQVYGNGEDESYAYSVGSTAVKRGVGVDSQIFTDGYRSEERFCLNTDMHFDAQMGSDIVDKVDWDFGDGVTLNNSTPQISHTYTSPGWYDVTANIYAHKECPETTYPAEPVTFSFYVGRPDTLYRNYYICEGESFIYGGTTYKQAATDTAHFDCDSVVIFHLEVGQRSYAEFDIVAKDEFHLGGKTYYTSGDYRDTLVNAAGCDSVVIAHARVVACLNMQLGAVDLPICGDQTELFIPYTVSRGDVGDAELVLNPTTRLALKDEGNGFTAPMQTIRPGKYPSAYVEVKDTNCLEDKRFNLPLEVLFPSSIFEQKWEDVLAVLNSRYNGGYDIIAYQWYKDGQPIPGATSSIYYVGPDNTLPTGSYSVLLTTSDGLQLMSCPKEVAGSANAAEAAKQGYLVAPGVLMLRVDGNDVLVR